MERLCGGQADERVQIVHKLLHDAINAALRQQAAAKLRTRPAVGVADGGGQAALPLRTWRTLPASDAELQQVAANACNQAVAWRVQGLQTEGMPIEVRPAPPCCHTPSSYTS